MARQQSALTNLLGEMRAVTEQAESTEPLLSKQLYDILRRADQLHTDNQLEMGGRLVDRGFLPQASEAERSARQNIDELRQSVDRAAESVLGSEAEALRYAQKELNDLAGQMAREMSARTNSTASAAEAGSRDQGQTNSPATAGEPRRPATWQRPRGHQRHGRRHLRRRRRRCAGSRRAEFLTESARGGAGAWSQPGKQAGKCESGAAGR